MKIQLLNYLLEASICLGIFYLFYYLLLRNERFFAYNRIFILLAFALSLLIPVMEIPLTQQAIYLSQQPVIDRYIAYVPLEVQEQHPKLQPHATPEPAAIVFWNIVFYGYILVALLVCVRLLVQLTQLYKMARKSGRKKDRYILVATSGKLPTFSFFHWLFWDDTQALSPENEKMILAHELVHICQKHSWDTLLLEVVKIIFWFNPAIYLFRKTLREVHEYLADQEVSKDYPTQAYTLLLAKQGINNLTISFTHSFNQSHILKRIAMIQSAQHPAKRALWKMVFALPVIAILLGMYSCKTSEITEPKSAALADGKAIYRLNEMVVVGYYTKQPDIREIQLNETITGYGTSNKNPAIALYRRVEVMPEPVDGISSFQHYIRKNLQPPVQTNKVMQGRVWVEFIVNTDGRLSDVSVVKSPDAYYTEEIIELIKNAPAWKPGKQNGQLVAVRKLVPISFGTLIAETSLTQATLIADKPTESQPVPAEGLEAFYKRIGKTVRYPEASRRDFIEGQVWVQFTVNPDGNLSEIEIAESLHPELDREVIRVVSEAGLSWKPVMVNERAQPSKVLFPVSFKLGV